MKRPIEKLGKCLCQRDGTGWLVMTPDGQIENAETVKQARAICNRWFKANVNKDSIGVGVIEWHRL